MKTETILKAIDVLTQCCDALAIGNLDVHAQLALSSKCSRAAFHLRHELEKAVPEVKIEADSTVSA